VLGRFPGLSAVEVAERTLMDKVAVSRAVTKLIKHGRIDREFADADKRRSILNLSEDGKRLHDEIAALALQFERDLLQGFEEQEIANLNSIMERLLARASLIGSP
jgi:DNA-binding MarR family transcriptional regulator